MQEEDLRAHPACDAGCYLEGLLDLETAVWLGAGRGWGLAEAIILAVVWPSPCFPFPPLSALVQKVGIRLQRSWRPHLLLRMWAVGCGPGLAGPLPSWSPTEGHA